MGRCFSTLPWSIMKRRGLQGRPIFDLLGLFAAGMALAMAIETSIEGSRVTCFPFVLFAGHRRHSCCLSFFPAALQHYFDRFMVGAISSEEGCGPL